MCLMKVCEVTVLFLFFFLIKNQWFGLQKEYFSYERKPALVLGPVLFLLSTHAFKYSAFPKRKPRCFGVWCVCFGIDDLDGGSIHAPDGVPIPTGAEPPEHPPPRRFPFCTSPFRKETP